jgi:SAM-dependent methyltransferase
MKNAAFSPAGAHYESIARTRPADFQSPLMARLPGHSKILLDAGCAAGRLTLQFARAVDFAVGLDLWPDLVNQARAFQAERAATNVAWVVGDIEHPPFAAESFDVVVSTNVLRLTDFPVAVERLGELVKPGGRMAVQDLIDASRLLGPIPVAYLFRLIRGAPRYFKNFGPVMLLRILAYRLGPRELARAARVSRMTPGWIEESYRRLLPGSSFETTPHGYETVWDK